MSHIDFDRVLSGFDERMKNMGVFSGLFELNKKERYAKYPLMSLSMAIMLFILENMLTNNKATTPEDITYFLKDLINDKYGDELSLEEAAEIENVLVDEFLRNKSAPHEFNYYDWEEQKEKKHTYHYIELDKYSIHKSKVNGRQFKLSHEGIEMLFKTKEMFSELQISISQLYFKQQMAKGFFSGAMQTVKEIELNIISQKQKMRELQTRIKRDAIGVSEKNELETRMDSIHKQITQEKELFDDLEKIVEKTLNDYYEGRLTLKERNDISFIRQIQRSLMSVINLHQTLLSEKQKLQHVMSESIESLIANAFSTTVNFEKEVLHKVLDEPTSLHTLKSIVSPLFPLKVMKVFNPSKVFEPQKRTKKSEEKSVKVEQLDEEEVIEKDRQEQRDLQVKEEKQYELLSFLVKPLLTQESITIKKLLTDLKSENPAGYHEMTSDLDLFSLIVQMNQQVLGFVRIEPEELPTIESILHRNLSKLTFEYPDLAMIERFSIYPLEDVIELESGFKVSNFAIMKGDIHEHKPNNE